jgi:hypothetical protein
MSAMMDLPVSDADAALRRCALALHAIGAQDRQWMLGKLPDAARAELERLVGELQALGIPADTGVTQDLAKAARSAPPAASAAVHPASPTARAEFAQAQELAQVLQHEPPALIAHVLGMRWDSADAVLACLNASKRRQVQELMPATARAGATAPRLSQALLEEISLRLAHARPAPAAPSAPWRARWASLARMLP